MSKRDYQIDAKLKNLEKLRQYYNEEILAIPELQRNFVWNASRLRDLADSIFKGYAIGTFTIWNAPHERESFLRHVKGLLHAYDSHKNNRIHYVIDGQQRLTALYSFLVSGGMEITNDRGQVFNSRNVCFSVNKDEDGLNFVYLKRGPEEDSYKFFSLCDILRDDYRKKFGYIKNKNTFKKIEECRKKFDSYKFCFIYINKDIKENNLRETFIRLNTRGLSLSAVDRAYAYASNVGLREYIGKIKARLGIFSTINDKPIHEVIYVINKKGSKKFNSKAIDTIFKTINDNKEVRENFENKEWKKIADAVAEVEDFLKDRGVLSLEYLPSTTMIAVLSTFFYYNKNKKVNPFQIEFLNKWFWYSSVSGRYSGKGYHYASEDCEKMEQLADGKKVKLEEIKKVDKVEIDNCLYYRSKSSLSRAFYCLLAQQKPKGFIQGHSYSIDLTQPTYKQKKQNHHIFPENLMDDLVSANKYNSIVNICFLPRIVNASFSDERPSDYLNEKNIDKDNLDKILKSHLIPLRIRRENKDLKKSFYKFFDERRSIIIKMFEREAGFELFE